MAEVIEPSTFLSSGSQGEVAAMTGAHTRRGQIRNLQQNGVPHTVNAAGWPVVARAVAEGRLKAAPVATEWRSQAPPFSNSPRRKKKDRP